MFVVDSQVHIWKADSPDRPWAPGGYEHLRKTGHRSEPFSYEELLELMDAGGVSRAVIVPPSWEGSRLDYGLEASEKHPDRFCVMARISLNKPAEAKAMMKDWATCAGIKGVRLSFLHSPDRNWIVDGTADWFWPFAEENQIPVMVNAPIWKTQLAAIASRHPGLKIIVDHMGILSKSVDDAIAPFISETAKLHVHPNIFVKASSVPDYSTQPFPYENINGYVRDLISVMGAERCFWGTDITRLTESHGIDYRQAVEHFTKHLGLAENELDQVMGRGLCSCIGWPVPN